jgi:hypothetical protein
MRAKGLFMILVLALSFTSCMPTYFYQVYKVKPLDKNAVEGNILIFEDENCVVNYNLWGENGSVDFEFFNKSDQNIYLDLNESFFILNGIANDYFKNRVTTTAASNGISTSTKLGLLAASSTGASVSITEKKIICIPSQTTKLISEFNINESLYRDCDLYKYPTKKQIVSKSFEISNSPIVFSNRFQYVIGDSKEKVNFVNEFYVEEITNFPDSEMVEMEHEEFCGQKSFSKVAHLKEVSPSSFYIKYLKGQDSWKH